MSGRVHVIGAGLAGLAAAVRLAQAGRPVTIYEAAGHAGGRCRSFYDEALGRRIDNGNHLLLSGNRSAYAYLDAIAARDQLAGPERAEYAFVDLESGERWLLRPGSGAVPWWIFCPSRRVPGSHVGEYLRGLRLARVTDEATVAECLDGDGVLFRRFWEPLSVAVLNTRADEAAASLLWPVIRETFGRGEEACRPRIARKGLSESFVDPALAALDRAGAAVRFGARVRGLDVDDGGVTALRFAGQEDVAVDAADAVIVAVPPAAAVALIPRLTAPQTSRAIVNGHFRLDRSVGEPGILGIVGGVCQWLFLRDDIASVTVSAADSLAEQGNDAIAALMWTEVARALDLGAAPIPAFRIVKEKRATFAQTPSEVRRRPGCTTFWPNLYLAGDWTRTGLPATIEGTVRSGHTAAKVVLGNASTA